jgi:hypothetical protein
MEKGVSWTISHLFDDRLSGREACLGDLAKTQKKQETQRIHPNEKGVG